MTIRRRRKKSRRRSSANANNDSYLFIRAYPRHPRFTFSFYRNSRVTRGESKLEVSRTIKSLTQWHQNVIEEQLTAVELVGNDEVSRRPPDSLSPDRYVS